MELNWTTFLLEVINFLILVWLLKRFLYQPVLNAIENRQHKIKADLLQATAVQEEAHALKKRYESRLADWEREKRTAFDTLEIEIAQERGRLLEQLDTEIAQQRLKSQAREQQQQTQWRTQAEAEAVQIGSAFASRLLTKLAGPELDMQLQQLLVEELAALPDEARDDLRRGWQDDTVSVEVLSATPLDTGRQTAIRQAVEQALGPLTAHWQFCADDSLIAGLRISIGSWVLQANLQDELRFFSEAAHGR